MVDPVSELFAQRGDDFVRFCQEWIKLQGPPEGVLKNSSRAPGSEESPERPDLVKTASASSSIPKEESSGPESRSGNGSPQKTALVARGK